MRDHEQRRLACTLLAATLLAACSSNTPAPGAEAGSQKLEASVPKPDLGVPKPDLGVPKPDLGVPKPDLGTLTVCPSVGTSCTTGPCVRGTMCDSFHANNALSVCQCVSGQLTSCMPIGQSSDISPISGRSCSPFPAGTRCWYDGDEYPGCGGRCPEKYGCACEAGTWNCAKAGGTDAGAEKRVDLKVD